MAKKQSDLQQLVDKFVRCREAVTVNIDRGWNWDDETFSSFVNSLSAKYPKVALNTIIDEITNIIGPNAIGDVQNPAEQVNALLRNLESLIANHRVYVPLMGLVLYDSPLQIGKFTLYRVDEGPLLEFEKKEAVKSFVEGFRSFSTCYTIIESVEGDQNYVTEQAYGITEGLVSLLSLFRTRDKHNLYNARRIHLGGVKLGMREQIVLCERMDNSTPYRHSAKQKRLDYHDNFLYSSKIEIWKQDWKLDRFIHIMETNQPSKFDQRMRRAINWFSRAINADEIDDQLVAYCTVLETLFGQQDTFGPSITQRLAEAVAFLCGQDYEQRLDLEKLTRNLYALRSEIVHSGIPNACIRKKLDEDLKLSDRDLAKLISDAIFATINHDFKDMEDLAEFIKKRKYSIP